MEEEYYISKELEKEEW